METGGNKHADKSVREYMGVRKRTGLPAEWDRGKNRKGIAGIILLEGLLVVAEMKASSFIDPIK